MEDPGKLIGLDEYFAHQIDDPFATIASQDVNWTERTWHSIFKKDGSIVINFGLGRYHNRGVLDGFGGISRGREQWTVRGSRELRDDPLEMTVGPLQLQITEPLRQVRVTLDRNEVQPIAFDISLSALMPAFLEDRQRQRDADGFRMPSVTARYHQHGEPSGWVDIEGQRIEIRPAEWRCFRDHSWGVRLDVGQPLTDIRPTTMLGDSKFSNANYALLWTRGVLSSSSGERAAYHSSYQVRNDKIAFLSAYRYHADGSRERIARVHHELRFDDRTRRLLGGRIHFDMLEGGTRTIELTVLGDTGFHLGTGLYFGFAGKKMGSWRGKLDVDGEKISDVSDVAALHRVHQFRDTPVEISEDGWKGFGGFSSVLIGAHPRLALTAENSFV